MIVYERTYFGDMGGKALDSGSLYIGQANQDPEVYPVQCYYDAALTVPASQPLSISSGYVINGGARSAIYTASSTYSLRVRDRQGVQVDYIPEIGSVVTTAFSRADLKAMVPPVGRLAFLLEAGRDGQFILRNGTPPADPLEGIYIRSDLGNFYWERVWDRINGYPEWWGAVSGFTGDGGLDVVRATANLLALNACMNLCAVVHLKGEVYVLNDTWWVNKPHVTVLGTSAAIEDGVGTLMVQLDRTKSVIRVGGTSMADLRARITMKQIGVRWWNGGPLPTANPFDAPRGFDIRYALACDLDYPFAYDPVVGFYAYGTIACHIRNSGATRTSLCGSNDFYRGYWCGGGGPAGTGGSLPGFAGQNASIYFHDINSTMGGDAQTASIQALPSVAMYADGDFADLFVDGFETSGVPRSLHLNGTGFTGHWDARFNRLTFDQGDEDGCIRVENVSSKAAIMFNDVYLQFNQGAPDSPSGGSNRGIWIEGGGGAITFDNTQVLTGGDKTRAIYVKNQTNVIFSKTCIVKGAAFPVTFDVGSKNATFLGVIMDDGNSSGATRAALSIVASVGANLAPIIQGVPNSFSAGINFIGADHTSGTIDPTGIDIGINFDGRKTVINGVKITAPGYYTPAGGAGAPGTGINVMGITV